MIPSRASRLTRSFPFWESSLIKACVTVSAVAASDEAMVLPWIASISSPVSKM